MATTSGTANWSIWSTASSGTTSGNDTWDNWISIDSASPSTTTANVLVWDSWTLGPTATDSTTSQTGRYYTAPKPRELTEAELEAQRVRAERQRQEVLERQQAWALADKKAKAILRESLNDGQRECYDRDSHFFVESEQGNKYRIRLGSYGNVDEIDEQNRIVATHCIAPRAFIPYEDGMLIQKLMLETEEVRFRQIANRTARREPMSLAA